MRRQFCNVSLETNNKSRNYSNNNTNYSDSCNNKAGTSEHVRNRKSRKNKCRRQIKWKASENEVEDKMAGKNALAECLVKCVCESEGICVIGLWQCFGRVRESERGRDR